MQSDEEWQLIACPPYAPKHPVDLPADDLDLYKMARSATYPLAQLSEADNPPLQIGRLANFRRQPERLPAGAKHEGEHTRSLPRRRETSGQQNVVGLCVGLERAPDRLKDTQTKSRTKRGRPSRCAKRLEAKRSADPTEPGKRCGRDGVHGGGGDP